MKKHPGRLQHLSDELDNLAAVAMRLGYNPSWLSPVLRQQYDAALLRQGHAPAPVIARALEAPGPVVADPGRATHDRPLRRHVSLAVEDRRVEDAPVDADIGVVAAAPVAAWGLPDLTLPVLPGGGAATVLADAMGGELPAGGLQVAAGDGSDVD